MKLVGDIPLVCVPGTWAWRGQNTRNAWYQAGSPWVTFMEAHGYKVLSKDRPFVWTTQLAGIPFLTGKRDWEAGGANLWAYLDPAIKDYGVGLRTGERNLVAHSHGLQVVLYACAAGCRINTLISVGSPIREDMKDVAIAARHNIHTWVHLYGGHKDRWQWLGELFDGKLGVVRRAAWERDGKIAVQADCSVQIDDIGHSDLLCNPAQFHNWTDVVVQSYIRGGRAEA